METHSNREYSSTEENVAMPEGEGKLYCHPWQREEQQMMLLKMEETAAKMARYCTFFGNINSNTVMRNAEPRKREGKLQQ